MDRNIDIHLEMSQLKETNVYKFYNSILGFEIYFKGNNVIIENDYVSFVFRRTGTVGRRYIHSNQRYADVTPKSVKFNSFAQGMYKMLKHVLTHRQSDKAAIIKGAMYKSLNQCNFWPGETLFYAMRWYIIKAGVDCAETIRDMTAYETKAMGITKEVKLSEPYNAAAISKNNTTNI